MHVLILSQYFLPETGATTNRIVSLAKGLQQNGHRVTVVTAKPNHPEGVVPEEYQGGLIRRDEQDGIPTIHTAVYTTPETTFATRILNYTTFMTSAVLGAVRAEGSVDVVLASSPPLFVGPAGWVAARLLRARFVFDVRDLWPDLAVAMNELNDPTKIWLAKHLEHFIYHRADAITAVTDGFCDAIRSVTGPSVPIERVMNGTVPSIFERDEARKPMRETLCIGDKFVVTYAGNIGICQGLDHILDAAEELRGRGRDDVLFRMIGSGPVKDRLREDAERRGLENLEFHPRVSLDEAAAHMSAADALLVPLARHEIYRSFIPSKLFDSMAAGRPVLLSVDGESRDILERADAGRYYEAEDGAALARHVERMSDHPDEAQAMGERGRDFASTHCTRSVQADRMVDFLEKLVSTA
jgi:glycosyltransferase involved in cell wall biosynthesis